MTSFFVLMFLFNMAASFAHPVTPTIIQTLELHDYMFGLALGTMMFTNFLFAPFWGKLSDYISSRWTLLICGLGYGVGQLFFGLARTELQFVLARMFAGAFIGGSYVCFLTYVANRSPEDKRGRNLAISATIQAVSGAFGYFVGGMVGELGTYYPVWLQAATLSGCALLFFFTMTSDAKEPVSHLTGEVIRKECNPFSAFLRCGKILTPAMVALFLFYGLSSMGFTAFDNCFNYYIRDQFGLSSGYNGVIKAALGVITLVANSTICMWILKRKDTTGYLVGLTFACTLSMLGVILCRELVPFIVVNVIFFAFYQVSLPLTQNRAAELGRGKESNLVMGAINSIKSFGGIFGALSAGFAYEISPRLPFILGFCGFALAAVFALRFWRIEKREGLGVQ